MTSHIEPGILAALAEGRLPSEEADGVRAHFADCRSCMAAYADAVRYRAAWLAEPEAFEPDAAMLAAARRALGESGFSATPAGRFPARRVALIAAGLLVAVLGPVGYSMFERSPALRFRLPEAVREATERSSARGLVLPGGAGGADRILTGMRSGQAIGSPALERELQASIAAYEGGARSSESGARVVAALLASGETGAASDYANECLRADPGNVPLLVFAADARYRLNDPPGAEELLRRARAAAPRDPIVGLDLALVLRGQGREDEARRLIEQVKRTRVAPLAARAARELDAPR